MASGTNAPSSPSGRLVFVSDAQPTVVLPAVAANLTLPNVIVPAAAIPNGATIRRVTVGVSWRKQVESSGVTNAIDGDQNVQVRADTPGTWINGVNVDDNTLQTAASATEGGILLMGDNDVSTEVDEADTYNFRWALALVDGASLTLHDVQTYLIVEYA
jgi:hypothetical protein